MSNVLGQTVGVSDRYALHLGEDCNGSSDRVAVVEVDDYAPSTSLSVRQLDAIREN